MLPFLKWAGGKRWLVNKYPELFPVHYNRYIEPFLGGGSVFFKYLPKISLLSDVNKSLIEVYKVIRDQCGDFLEALAEHDSRHSYAYYYMIRSKIYNDSVGRAAKFLYLNRTCWNGLYRVNKYGEFNVPIGTKTSVLLGTDNFKKLSDILKLVDLKCQDFEVTINLARKGDFIFVDPPYTVKHNANNFIKYNENLFSWKDQVRLKDAIFRAIRRKCKVLVCNADHPDIKKLYENIGSFHSLNRASVISADPKQRKMTTELIITA